MYSSRSLHLYNLASQTGIEKKSFYRVVLRKEEVFVVGPDAAAKELREILENMAWIDIPELEWKAEVLIPATNAPDDVQRLYERMLTRASKKYWNSAGTIAQQLGSCVSGPNLALLQISFCLVKKGELNHAEEILLRITGSGSVVCYVKNLLLGLIRARAGNLCEAACCFLQAVDVFGDRGNNASRKYVAGALALLGMKKEANYFLTQKTLDKMIILKTIRTIEENKNKAINQETGAINNGQSFLMIRNKLGTIDSRQARKEIKNDGSFRGVKMNLCLECAKATMCPGQLPCKLSWNRQGWYCPFGFVPTSPPTPYEG